MGNAFFIYWIGGRVWGMVVGSVRARAMEQAQRQRIRTVRMAPIMRAILSQLVGFLFFGLRRGVLWLVVGGMVVVLIRVWR